ncbi:MAG: phage/plasmid primase, P4 family [Candidatus Bathyarchaeia archaeon]
MTKTDEAETSSSSMPSVDDVSPPAESPPQDKWKCLDCGEEFSTERYRRPTRCANINCKNKRRFEALTGPFRYFQGEKFIAARMAEEIMKKHKIVTHMDTEVMYIYAGGVYLPYGEQKIREFVQQELGELATTHYVNEALECVRRSTYVPAEIFNSPPPHLVCVENGLLNIETLELLPHTPDLIFLSKLPVKYDPNATCPNILKFLEEVVPDEIDRTVLIEFIGYCLYRRYPIHKALMLVGGGNNGKSTFINLIKLLLGSQNVACRSLQELCSDRFAMADLYGKLANLFYDLPGSAIADTGPFKALVGGDTVKGEMKFKSAFFFENYAKLIFSANQIPRVSSDHSDAFFRRWIIINFPNTFEGEKADRNILKKIATPEELSGLLNLAVCHLRDLITRGDFSYSKTTEEIRKEYIRRSDPVGAFVMDILAYDPGWAVEKQALYAGFCEYCRREKMIAPNPETFYKHLQKHIEFAEERIRTEKGRLSVLVGIKLDQDSIEYEQVVEGERYKLVRSFTFKNNNGHSGQSGQGCHFFKINMEKCYDTDISKQKNENKLKIRKSLDQTDHVGQMVEVSVLMDFTDPPVLLSPQNEPYKVPPTPLGGRCKIPIWAASMLAGRGLVRIEKEGEK